MKTKLIQHLFTCSVCWFVLVGSAIAQDQNPLFQIRYHGGYFNDIFFANAEYDNPDFNRVHHGYFQAVEAYYFTQKKLGVGIKYNHGIVKRPMSDAKGLFWGENQKVNYSVVGLAILKTVQKGIHCFGLSGGPMLWSSRSTWIGYRDVGVANVTLPNDEVGQVPAVLNPEFDQSTEYDLGVSINLGYGIEVYRNLCVGINIEGHLLMNYGFENTMIGPFVSVGF